MLGRWIVGGLVAVLLVSSRDLAAQFPRPLSPIPEEGNRVAPFFDGWYANPDGTTTFSFGYSNLNKSAVEIPLGPDNFITPKEYDGRQPTSFPVVMAERQGSANTGVAGGAAGPAGAAAAATPAGASAGGATAGAGRASPGGAAGVTGQYLRERGVFTVTVPADYKGDVVWTLRHNGQTWAVPGRAKTGAYQLSWPMAMGSVPPLLRFEQHGPAGRGPTGIQGPPLRVQVGTPLEFTVWLTDDAVHEAEPIKIKREAVPSMNATWFKHAGPSAAPVVFSAPKVPVMGAQGQATTKATFNQPGEYVIRVRGDTFGHIDSISEDQCCWTNGYLKVEVTQ